MKIKYWFFGVILLFIASCSEEVLPTSIGFNRVYNFRGDVLPITVDELSDGGFVVTNRTDYDSVMDRSLVVLRTDKDGSIVWYKNYMPFLQPSRDLLVTPEGNFVVFCQKGVPQEYNGAKRVQAKEIIGSAMLLINGATGEIMRETILDKRFSEVVYAVPLQNKNEFAVLLADRSAKLSVFTGNFQTAEFKLAYLDNLLSISPWTRLWQKPNGNLVFSAYEVFQNVRNSVLTELDLTTGRRVLNFRPTQVLQANDIEIFDFLQDRKGNYRVILRGQSTEFIFLLGVSLNNQMEQDIALSRERFEKSDAFEYEFALNNLTPEYAVRMELLPNGNIALIGTSTRLNVVLTEFNDSGNRVRDNRNYGKSSLSGYFARDIQQTSDGGFILLNRARLHDVTSKINLLKIDGSGNLY